MSSLKAQGTKAFIWDFSGRLAQQGMGFVISIFLARLLEPADFGLVAMVMVIIGVAGIFIDIGLGGALIQRKRLHRVHYSSVFYFNVFVGLSLSLITYLSASYISAFYNAPRLLPIVEAMSVLFVINALNGVQIVRFHKALNYALTTKISFIASLISGIIGVSLAFWGAGVWSLVVQTLSMGMIGLILVWRYSDWIPSLEFSWKALTKLWGFGFRMFLSAVLASVFERLDFLVIGKLFTPATLGYFQRAKSLNGLVVQYSSGSLMRVLFPILSQVQRNLPRFQSIVLKAFGVLNFVAFFLVGALYLVSEELIVLLFSEKWLPSVAYFQILILSGFAYPLSALLVNVLASRGKSKEFLRLEIYKKSIAALNFLTLYYLGIEAFLYGLIVVSLYTVSLNIVFASREIKLSFGLFAKSIFVQASITVFSVLLTCYATKELELIYLIMLIVKTILFFVLYFVLNHLFQTKAYSYLVAEIVPKVQSLKKGKK